MFKNLKNTLNEVDYMGFTSISPGSLLLIFLIILLIFGTGKLRSIGEDLGHALRSFKKGLKNDEQQKTEEDKTRQNFEEK